jgi:hypothetical protein
MEPGPADLTDEGLRAWAVILAGGDVERAAAIVGFVRPPQAAASPRQLPPGSRLPPEAIDIICVEYPRDTKIAVIQERVRLATGFHLTREQIQRAATYRRWGRSPAAQAKRSGVVAARAARAANRAKAAV